jgi:hypothetical protein
MDFTPKPNYRLVRVVLPKNRLMNFIGELHEIQLQMIDDAVAIKEKDGFPEANEIIKNIREKTIGNQ